MSLIIKKVDIYNQCEQQDTVEKYAPLVKRIAYYLKGRLPVTIQLDDLIQSGMIGLLEAANNYDVTHGASFETYASIRIRGAMLDEVRKNDWAPRSVHRNSRRVAEVVRKIENKKGRDARDSEIAEELNIDISEYNRILQDASGHKILSFEEVGNGDESLMEHIPNSQNTLLDDVQKDDIKAQVAHAISSLPERERLVMALYYDEELNLREIGAVIGVSESRVSQIHSQAVIRLQARLSTIIKE
ncbi:MAG: RNA polymerase sigma factor FliA [gamma proteobacterium symbiont of Bathyaustriella thionipta]|nr:RNA polymerase sigma factor FliA [gamma proteobacterium symbiont of Bathyaustriella thionipta]MCU7951719.1 RNA polymerase sigma factor FliA [gamma proteobacterium symbiont of Bathyaustriella thionipta]MCU7958318.1 RNA polymerase sigma factor FliA [gamma proteobacterium symbiont of Bathyaustriella thionipta]MCU7968281.1 RNA polymerase sigma factor FliA [gamma proteobacterium symbiont of Bathyaustriella thionipta]